MSLHTKADFFVHPDYYRACHFVDINMSHITQYEQSLMRRIGNSALPVLMYDPELGEARGEFWDRFEPEHRFPTNPGFGVLVAEPRVHNRFNNLMRDNLVTEGTVHGSYLDACVITFKHRLHQQTDGRLMARPPEQRCVDGNYTGPDTVKFGVTLALDIATASELHTIRQGLAPHHFAPDAETYYL